MSTPSHPAPHAGPDGTVDVSGPSTTASGAPVASDRNSLSVGANGPLLLHDHHLVDTLQPMRCRLPAAVAHTGLLHPWYASRIGCRESALTRHRMVNQKL